MKENNVHSDEPATYIYHNFIGDECLKKEIMETGPLHKCLSCNTKQKSISLENLSDRIRDTSSLRKSFLPNSG